MLLLTVLLGCTPPDAEGGPAADTGDDAPPQTDAPVGGTVLAGGAGGGWRYDADAGGFVAFTAEPVATLRAAGGVITASLLDVVRSFDLASGAPLREVTVDCGMGTFAALGLEDAVWVEGVLWATCGADDDHRLVTVDPATGVATATGAAARFVFVDQGTLYAIDDRGRYGQFVHAVDRSSGALGPELGGTLALGGVRGDTWFGTSGEYGNSGFGSVRTGSCTTGARATIDFPAGEYPDGVDVIPGVAVLTDVLADAEQGVLLTEDGSPLDTLGACPRPLLVWGGDHLDGWCAGNVTRTRWTWADGAWQRAEQDALDVDASGLVSVEPGE